jgi:hypothetical protein
MTCYREAIQSFRQAKSISGAIQLNQCVNNTHLYKDQEKVTRYLKNFYNRKLAFGSIS